MTQKNSTALFFTTDFLILRLKLSIVTLFIGLLPSTAMAQNKIEVSTGHIESDLITLKVKVLNQENIPIDGLQAGDFKLQTAKIEKKGSNLTLSPITNFRLLEPGEEFQTDPAYVVILLDMSGSMVSVVSDDPTHIKKIDGAISAIRRFIKLVRDDRLPVQIALVPLGVDDSGKCKFAYDVNQDIIGKKLIPATDPKLDEQVNQLPTSNLCAATNLYDPVKEAVKFLGTPNRFSEQNVTPRLDVILLTDGYHDIKREIEAEQFYSLVDVLKSHPEVKVNTLGYGESLPHLRDHAINCNISDRILTTVAGVSRIQQCHLPGGEDIREYIVDQPRLRQMAQRTGGTSQFPKNAAEAVSGFETVFKSLREYQLQYEQPGAEAADQYQVIVSVDSPNRQIKLDAEPAVVRIPNLAIHRFPLIPDRLIIFGATLALLTITTKAFMGWSKKLKQEAERWL